MFFPFFKPVSRSHFFDQTEMIIQIGMNGPETIKKRAPTTFLALPTTLPIFALGTQPYFAVRISTSKLARVSAAKSLYQMQDG
jgi:hypothetical protein